MSVPGFIRFFQHISKNCFATEIFPIFSLLKKLTAIALLVLLLFNLAGYPIAFRFLQLQSDRALSQKVDNNNYNEADLVEVKIPLHLPYMSTNSDFERIDGTVEADGIHYNYVKRKISGDTLYILCLKNEQKTQLEKNKNEYSAGVHDFSTQKKSKESGITFNPVVEYAIDSHSIHDFSCAYLSHKPTRATGCYSLINPYIPSLAHPPQA